MAFQPHSDQFFGRGFDHARADLPVVLSIDVIVRYMRHTAFDIAAKFLVHNAIPFTAWGKEGSRCGGLEVKQGGVSFNIGFEAGELPVLGIHYVGSEGQFITEKFTDKSFPEVSGAFQAALSGMKQLKTTKERALCLDSLIDEYSILLTERYCGVLKRKWEAYGSFQIVGNQRMKSQSFSH